MNKQPEKTLRTKQHIIDSFWFVAKTQGVKKVTVTAITKKAQINRGTFYVYFEDINDLIEQAEINFILELQSKIKESIADGSFSDMRIVTQKFIELFTAHDEKFFILLGKNGDPEFLTRVRESAAELFKEMFAETQSAPYNGYIISYASSAFVGLITYWQDSGRQISLNELAELIYNISTQGILKTAFEYKI